MDNRQFKPARTKTINILLPLQHGIEHLASHSLLAIWMQSPKPWRQVKVIFILKSGNAEYTEGKAYHPVKKKDKDIPVTGRGGPYGCERSRIPHYLGKRQTDSSRVGSPTCQPPFTPRLLLFLLESESTPGP
jgi:hypothetical protein